MDRGRRLGITQIGSISEVQSIDNAGQLRTGLEQDYYSWKNTLLELAFGMLMQYIDQLENFEKLYN